MRKRGHPSSQIAPTAILWRFQRYLPIALALGQEIKMPALKAFMLQDYASFQEDPQLGYGAGLLLVTYFLQLDGAGDGKRIKAYLKALHDGKEGEDALAVLLDGRSFEELQQEITKAWGRKGVDFSFSKS